MKSNHHFSIPLPLKPLLKVCLLAIFAIGYQPQLHAQQNADKSPVFQGEKIEQTAENAALNQAFTACAIYQFDANALGKFVHTPDDDTRSLVLRFGEEHEWSLLLEPVDMVKPGATIIIASESGTETKPLPLIRAFKGVIADDPGNSEVRLTVNDDFIYGFVRRGDKSYYIEPLRYHVKGAAANQFVLYDAANAKARSEVGCGNTEIAEKITGDQPEESPCSGCKVLDLVVASDFSMFNKYGSVSEVLNHHIGVLNNINSMYDNEFSCEIRFVFGRLFFSTCQACDPWTSSLNSSDLLEDFKDWSNNSGLCDFTALGELWTNRDLDGALGVVGLAYTPGFCNDNSYHILQDFPFATASQLRVMTAHEIGHNLNCQHDYKIDGPCDPPGRADLVMDPLVSSTTTWSNGSQNCALNSVSTISNYVNGQNCISDCGLYVLLEAWVDFNYQSCYQFGQFDFPFNLLQFGVHRINSGGIITIKSSPSGTSSNETLTITKPCTIKSFNGTATIGKQ